MKLCSGSHDRWMESFYHWIGLSKKDFLSRNVRSLVPKMILSEKPSLIEKLAMVLDEKPGALCIQSIDNVLAEVYMESRQERFESCADILRKLFILDEPESGNQQKPLGITELTKISTNGLMCRLSFELGHEDPAKREKAQQIIGYVKGIASEASEQGLAVFMMQHVLSIMSEVNQAILDEHKLFNVRTKVKYLRSLAALVQMLDPVQRSVLSQVDP